MHRPRHITLLPAMMFRCYDAEPNSRDDLHPPPRPPVHLDISPDLLPDQHKIRSNMSKTAGKAAVPPLDIPLHVKYIQSLDEVSSAVGTGS